MTLQLTSLPGARITELDNPLEIKQRWLRSEWQPECHFSRRIRRYFLEKEELDPCKPYPDIQKIEDIFHLVRGRWSLWQTPRETAEWKKVEVDLPLTWARENVEILYPSEDKFEVSELDGIVLWDEGPPKEGKKWQLYEGNHRFSTWLAEGAPSSLPAVIFIGNPKL